MTHWRDLTDQLDAGDIARLTIHERAGNYEDALLLKWARSWAADRLLQDMYDDVPAPADAIEVDPWFGDPPRRSFTGATLFDGHVKIVGWQDPDGAIERRIVVGVDDLELTAGDAIRLCRAVSAAADEIKRLEG